MSASPTPHRSSFTARTCLAFAAGMAVVVAVGLAFDSTRAAQPNTHLALGLVAVAVAGLAAASVNGIRKRENEVRTTGRRTEARALQLRCQIDRLQNELVAPPEPTVGVIEDNESRRADLERMLRVKESELAVLQEESHRAATMLLQGHGEADVLRLRLYTMQAEERQLICRREDHEKRLAELQMELAETAAKLRERQEALRRSGVELAAPSATASDAAAHWSDPSGGSRPWAVHEHVFAVDADESIASFEPAALDPPAAQLPEVAKAEVAAEEVARRRLELAEAEMRLAALKALNDEAQKALNESMLGTEAETDQLQALIRLNFQRRRQIEGAERQLHDVEASLKTAAARLQELNGDFAAKRKELEDFAATTAEWNAQEETRRARLAEFAAAEERHTRDLKTLGSERDSLWAAIDKLRNELNTSATRHDEAARQCAALEAAVASADARKQRLEDECVERHREVETLGQRAAEIAARVAETETQCCERERDLALLGDRLAEAHRETSRLERSCRELEGQRRALDAQLSERRRDLDEAARQLEVAERRRAETIADMPDLQVRRIALMAEIERLATEKAPRAEDTQAAEAALQSTARDLESRRSQLGAIEAELAARSAELAAVRDERGRLEGDIADLKAQTEVALQAAIEAEDRNREAQSQSAVKLKELNWLVEGRQQDLTDFERRLADLRRIAAEQTERAKSAGETLERKQQEEDAAREKRREWEQYVAALKEQSERAEAELDCLEQDLVGVALQLEERQSELAAAEARLQEKKNEWDRLIDRTSRTAIARPQRPAKPPETTSEERTTSVGPYRRPVVEIAGAEGVANEQRPADGAWQRANEWGKFLDAAVKNTAGNDATDSPPSPPADAWHEAAKPPSRAESERAETVRQETLRGGARTVPLE